MRRETANPWLDTGLEKDGSPETGKACEAGVGLYASAFARVVFVFSLISFCLFSIYLFCAICLSDPHMRETQTHLGDKKPLNP